MFAESDASRESGRKMEAGRSSKASTSFVLNFT
jgi:hypothetical protein